MHVKKNRHDLSIYIFNIVHFPGEAVDHFQVVCGRWEDDSGHLREQGFITQAH